MKLLIAGALLALASSLRIDAQHQVEPLMGCNEKEPCPTDLKCKPWSSHYGYCTSLP